MRLAVGVLAVAILPSLAAAQSDSHSSSPAGPPATSSVEATGPSAAAPARVLVLDCPVSASGSATIVGRGEPNVDDTLGTSSLVAALCARATAGASASASAERRSEPTVRLQGEAHHEPEAAESAAPAAAIAPTLRLHLFADIRYSAIDSMGSKNGFALGQFDLFARSQISENLSVLTEATLTALPRNSFNTQARAPAAHLLAEQPRRRVDRPLPHGHRVLQRRVPPRHLVPDRGRTSHRVLDRRRHRCHPDPYARRLGHG